MRGGEPIICAASIKIGIESEPNRSAGNAGVYRRHRAPHNLLAGLYLTSHVVDALRGFGNIIKIAGVVESEKGDREDERNGIADISFSIP